MIALVCTLTGGRPTAASERWILWELPLARAQQYLHAAWRRQGTECEWAGRRGAAADARAKFAAACEAWRGALRVD